MTIKINELLEAIERKDTLKATELTIELKNTLRDFSQCIVLASDNENDGIKTFDGAGSKQYMAKLKKEILQWVGGR